MNHIASQMGQEDNGCTDKLQMSSRRVKEAYSVLYMTEAFRMNTTLQSQGVEANSDQPRH